MRYRFALWERENIMLLPAIIEQNLAKGLDIEVLCRETAMSYRRLLEGSRVFLGRPLSVVIRDTQMQLAHRLLTGSDRGIKDVAGDCGYRDVKSFHRAFRKYYGITPKDLRAPPGDFEGGKQRN